MNSRRFIGYILIIIIVLGSNAFPYDVFATTPNAENPLPQDQPYVSVQNLSTDLIEVSISFPENALISGENGLVFDENQYHHPSNVGSPDLPVMRKDIELPFAADYSLKIIDRKSYFGKLGEEGLPTSIPVREPETEKSCDCQEGEEFEQFSTSNSKGLFPSSPAQILNTYIIRGHKIGQLEIWPVQYNQADNTVEIFQEMTLRITAQGEILQTSALNSGAYSSSTFENLLSDQIVNYNQELQGDSQLGLLSDVMLIITPDAFISTLSKFTHLKETQGYTTKLIELSKIGATPQAIKNFIQSAYNNWTNPPTYVLLVGDVDNGNLTMPAFTGVSSQSVTDLYYGTVDGTDWIPDIFVGRLPARNITQLNIMIDNLIAYENLSGTEAWIKKASFLASNDDNYWDVAEATQKYVIENHTLPEGYSGVYPSAPQSGGDKLFAHTYAAGNANVVQSINNKRSLIAYSGHGSRSGWGAPLYDQSNIQNINHNDAFSVVASFACVTGDFSATESFGETWLSQENKGAVAFIGSSSSSYWGPDDTLERAMMDSLYSGSESANIVGQFFYAGLMAIEAERPGTGTAQSRYYWEIYNLLGDPSLAALIDYKEQEEYNPVFKTSSVSASQAPGYEAVVQVELTNRGCNPDTYTINLAPDKWSPAINSKASIGLAPGETTTIEITLLIPEDAEPGQIEQYILSVTSNNDPANPPAEDSITIDIKVEILSYIPLINAP